MTQGMVEVNILSLVRHLAQSRWKDPPYPPVGWGAHVCSGASCYVWEKFSGCVQMYDGCCPVRWRLKRSPENWGPIVVVSGGAHLGLRRHWFSCLMTFRLLLPDQSLCYIYSLRLPWLNSKCIVSPRIPVSREMYLSQEVLYVSTLSLNGRFRRRTTRRQIGFDGYDPGKHLLSYRLRYSKDGRVCSVMAFAE